MAIARSHINKALLLDGEEHTVKTDDKAYAVTVQAGNLCGQLTYWVTVYDIKELTPLCVSADIYTTIAGMQARLRELANNE